MLCCCILKSTSMVGPRVGSRRQPSSQSLGARTPGFLHPGNVPVWRDTEEVPSWRAGPPLMGTCGSFSPSLLANTLLGPPLQPRLSHPAIPPFFPPPPWADGCPAFSHPFPLFPNASPAWPTSSWHLLRLTQVGRENQPHRSLGALTGVYKARDLALGSQHGGECWKVLNPQSPFPTRVAPSAARSAATCPFSLGRRWERFCLLVSYFLFPLRAFFFGCQIISLDASVLLISF